MLPFKVGVVQVSKVKTRRALDGGRIAKSAVISFYDLSAPALSTHFILSIPPPPPSSGGYRRARKDPLQQMLVARSSEGSSILRTIHSPPPFGFRAC